MTGSCWSATRITTNSALVRLEELIFLPVVDGTTVMNLYKAGEATVTTGLGVPPIFVPVLSRKKDYHAASAFGTVFPCISTRKAPFDNVLLRYALNMATDKKALTDFMGPGYVPARSLIAPWPDTHGPTASTSMWMGESTTCFRLMWRELDRCWQRLDFREA